MFLDIGYHSGGRGASSDVHNLLKRTPAQVEEAKKAAEEAAKAAAEKAAADGAPSNGTTFVPIVVEEEPAVTARPDLGSGPFALTGRTKFLILKYHGK